MIRVDVKGESRLAPRGETLQQIVDGILSVTTPDRIVLFGSQARREGRAGSDFDILVVQESTQPRFQRAVPMYVALADLPVEVDVVVYTPSEIREWSAVPQAFVTTAMREGRVLYERER
jgi:predicted nucleotidyltransferase